MVFANYTITCRRCKKKFEGNGACFYIWILDKLRSIHPMCKPCRVELNSIINAFIKKKPFIHTWTEHIGQFKNASPAVKKALRNMRK